MNEPIILVKQPEDKIEIIKPVERKEVSDTNPDILRKSQDRIKKLKDLSMKIKTSQGVTELEKEPAYVRKNIVLSNVASSAESQVSRYSLTEDDDKNVELKQNNSFLHDNVD